MRKLRCREVQQHVQLSTARKDNALGSLGLAAYRVPLSATYSFPSSITVLSVSASSLLYALSSFLCLPRPQVSNLRFLVKIAYYVKQFGGLMLFNTCTEKERYFEVRVPYAL